MEKTLSDEDLRNLTYPDQCGIITNDQLDRVDNIETLFHGWDIVYVLYPWWDNGTMGHWCCITRSPGRYVFFDSYGKYVDKFASSKLKRNITRLFLTAPRSYDLQYNNVQLQSDDERVTTCGRWAVLWGRAKDDYKDVDTFSRDMLQLADEMGITPDQLAVKYTSNNFKPTVYMGGRKPKCMKKQNMIDQLLRGETAGPVKAPPRSARKKAATKPKKSLKGGFGPGKRRYTADDLKKASSSSFGRVEVVNDPKKGATAKKKLEASDILTKEFSKGAKRLKEFENLLSFMQSDALRGTKTSQKASQKAIEKYVDKLQGDVARMAPDLVFQQARAGWNIHTLKGFLNDVIRANFTGLHRRNELVPTLDGLRISDLQSIANLMGVPLKAGTRVKNATDLRTDILGEFIA